MRFCGQRGLAQWALGAMLILIAALQLGGTVLTSPFGKDFNYAKEFASLNLNAVKQDIQKVLEKSKGEVSVFFPSFIRTFMQDLSEL